MSMHSISQRITFLKFVSLFFDIILVFHCSAEIYFLANYLPSGVVLLYNDLPAKNACHVSVKKAHIYAGERGASLRAH